MNSPKITNILLLLIVLLLCFHVGLETFRPVGRYVHWSSSAVLDTSSGTTYWENGTQGIIVNVVNAAKTLPKFKFPEPEAPTGEPPGEEHRP